MFRTRRRAVLLAALLSSTAAVSLVPRAPAALAVDAAPKTFTYDSSSSVTEQDQLAAQLSAATTRQRPLRVASGSITLTRTLWLPVGGQLVLGPKATLTGSIAGQSLVRLQSKSRLSGGTVWNRASSDCFDVDVSGRTAGATIEGVTLRGDRTNALYVNAPEVRNLTVRSNHFIGAVYGVLVNPGAVRSRGITIDRNTFDRITGDAVELNTPVSSPVDAVRTVSVTRNTVRAMRGTGSSSGFAVGIAGVRGFRIAGNRLHDVRNEAVHLEAGAADGVVQENLILGGGSGTRPAIAVYRTVDDVRIRQNVLDRFKGSGVAVLWDSVGSSTRITVRQNLIRRVTGDGIVMGGDSGTGPFVTRRNVVIGAQNGIVTLGVHEQDIVASNLVRDVRAGSLVSRYQGTSRRTVLANSTAKSTTIRSVVGWSVVRLARSGYPKPAAKASTAIVARSAVTTGRTTAARHS